VMRCVPGTRGYHSLSITVGFANASRGNTSVRAGVAGTPGVGAGVALDGEVDGAGSGVAPDGGAVGVTVVLGCVAVGTVAVLGEEAAGVGD
jgi:hypothetical protein